MHFYILQLEISFYNQILIKRKLYECLCGSLRSPQYWEYYENILSSLYCLFRVDQGQTEDQDNIIMISLSTHRHSEIGMMTKGGCIGIVVLLLVLAICILSRLTTDKVLNYVPELRSLAFIFYLIRKLLKT